MRRAIVLVALLLGIWAQPAFADKIKLANGREMQGVVEEDNGTTIKVRTRGGTVTMPRGDVVSIDKSPAPGEDVALPKWDDFMAPTAKLAWLDGLRQIPATVIDNGVMKYVPYLSYQVGDYELNVYGDPDHPAGVEIGVRNESLKGRTAKANCIKFMAEVLKNKKLTDTLFALNMDKDSKEIDGITIEITPETDPDAYGGWWISAYSIPKLDKSRATEAEMAQITVKRSEIAAAATQPIIPTASARSSDPAAVTAWTPDDLGRARKASGAGGSVYVRGYTKKDGTYVHSYTRAAPGHGGGRR